MAGRALLSPGVTIPILAGKNIKVQDVFTLAQFGIERYCRRIVQIRLDKYDIGAAFGCDQL